MTARPGRSGRYFTRTQRTDGGQRGHRLAHAAVDVTRLHRLLRVDRLELEIHARECTEQRRPPNAQDAPVRGSAAFQDLLLQLRAERDGAGGSDHGDERADEK